MNTRQWEDFKKILNNTGEKKITYEELLKKEKIDECELKDVPIYELPLSNRCLNHLYPEVKNLDELIECALLGDLWGIKNIGHTTISEISKVLNDIFYKIDFKANSESPKPETVMDLVRLGIIDLEVVESSSFSAGKNYTIEKLIDFVGLRKKDDDYTSVILKYALAKCGIFFDEDLKKLIGVEKSSVMDEEVVETNKVEKEEKTTEKDELLEKLLTSKKGLGILMEISCQSFVKGSEE